MNTATAATNEYVRRASATRNRRRARGEYRRPSEAMKLYIGKGVTALSEEEKGIVRGELAAMRISVNW